jgi:hypothetical protein
VIKGPLALLNGPKAGAKIGNIGEETIGVGGTA